MKRARKSGNGAMTTLGDMRAEEGPLITGGLQVVRRYPHPRRGPVPGHGYPSVV